MTGTLEHFARMLAPANPLLHEVARQHEDDEDDNIDDSDDEDGKEPSVDGLLNENDSGLRAAGSDGLGGNSYQPKEGEE
jgi:hypothetical protein